IFLVRPGGLLGRAACTRTRQRRGDRRRHRHQRRRRRIAHVADRPVHRLRADRAGNGHGLVVERPLFRAERGETRTREYAVARPDRGTGNGAGPTSGKGTAAVTDRQWLCAYVITRNGPCDYGLDPAPWLVGHGDLGIVVSEIEPEVFEQIDPMDPADGGLVRLARRHDEVVRAVFRQAPVLPLRFGTVLAGTDAAVRLLRRSYDQALPCLAQIEGHREWGVRARLAGASQARDDLTGLSGTEYLTLRRERLTSARRSRQSAAEAVGLLHTAL